MEEKNQNIIKTFTPHKCPHCGKEILIGTSQLPVVVDNVFTNEQIASAKKELIEKVSGLGIEDAERKSLMEWINDENTMFGPDNVMEILKNILDSIKK